MSEKVKQLETVGLYHAPKNARIKPFVIPADFEYLELIVSGHTFFRRENGPETEYGRGTLFWHTGGEHTVYRYREDDPYSCYVFKFGSPGGNRPCGRVSTPLRTERLIGFAEDAFRLYHSGEQDNPAFCMMVYSTLAWYASGPQRTPGEQYPAVLKTALSFLESCIGEKVHLDEAASAAGISQPHLFYLFRRYLGKSPHQYLLEMRISQAKQMLAGGENPIKEIAADCGFESLEVFYRQFARSEGTTPAAYRKRFLPPDRF